MSNVTVEMIEAVFDISGEPLTSTYPEPLWHELVKHLPVLSNNDAIGVLRLRTANSNAGMLLPKRAKLVLRIPSDFATPIMQLAHQDIEVKGAKLQLGQGKIRQLTPSPTLHAHLVSSYADEITFMQEVAENLLEVGVVGKLICGMRNSLETLDGTIHGYSLVVHDLKPEASLRLQYLGLGSNRRYGCGIFVPYKAISDLD